MKRKNTKGEPSDESEKFLPLSLTALESILSSTIKGDRTNKLITFLAFLTAYTHDSQVNIINSGPSSTGKSYLPLEISKLFPLEDVRKLAYCSPTAFFHQEGKYDEAKNKTIIDLSRRIIIFMDQPHYELLAHLRPLLSHFTSCVLSNAHFLISLNLSSTAGLFL